MLDFEAPSSLAVLKLLDDELVRKRLHDIAFDRTKSDSDADDLVQAALLRVFNPDDAPWDSNGVTFFTHMHRVMRQTRHEQMRRARVKREVLDETLTDHERVLDPEPTAESEVARAESVSLEKMLMQEVLAEIGDKHPIARQVYELGAQGVEDVREQATAIGCTPDEVRLAVKQLRYAARRALERWEMAEERRMKELADQRRTKQLEQGKKAPTEEAP